MNGTYNRNTVCLSHHLLTKESFFRIKKMRVSLRGKHGWNQVFSDQFGKKRWKYLKNELKKKNRLLLYHPHLALSFTTSEYQYCDIEYFQDVAKAYGLKSTGLPDCYIVPDAFNNNANDLSLSMKLPLAYFIDAASCMAAYMLKVKPGNKVLDFCAAPGGKSLILMSQLFPCLEAFHSSTPVESLLVCHDRCTSRVKRLQSNIIKRCNPTIWSRKYIQITSSSQKAKLLGPFDKILLDAPCSTDRHVMNDPSKLVMWNEKDVKRNAERQLNLILEALPSLRDTSTARLLYCTCALSTKENDGVIESLLTKSQYKNVVYAIPPCELIKEMYAICPDVPVKTSREENATTGDQTFKNLLSNPNELLSLFLPEETIYGLIFLPDTCRCGPLYVAALQWCNSM
ncbi:tRNA (cytosine(34)-C(5))-methyltransferase, mitochondrial-like [Hylaeus volcanicus]|uniref:tRNA (cytosine(34)-C(5))-methyltransferase, mitochondrial-like n=1 Tax=Hylaeus volcanicus TaxID=313075 RepID=UPI0023B83CA6|nr:tRNA (cytosine(34)-C(5))-methyltransferase, mitochondrial-like [Hylaeus volcanicus]